MSRQRAQCVAADMAEVCASILTTHILVKEVAVEYAIQQNDSSSHNSPDADADI